MCQKCELSNERGLGQDAQKWWIRLGSGPCLASSEQVCRQHSPCANIKHICRHAEPVLRR